MVGCSIRLGKYSDAVYWIDAALPIPVLTAEVHFKNVKTNFKH